MNIADFRKVENLHIAFWLTKDMCWVADLKILGMIMIAPTLGVAIWLTIKMRSKQEELFHNLAVLSWICANVTWMVGEFWFNDETRPIAIVFFAIGLALLGYFYGRRLLMKKR